MCTGFIKKGDDIICGYNLDIDPAIWNYAVYKKKDCFTVGIKVGSTLYYTHGVNNLGNFGSLPYMNGPLDGKLGSGCGRERVDLLVDRYIRKKLSFADVLDSVQNKTIVNIMNGSLHALLGDGEGNMLLVEPSFGYKKIEDSFAVVTNFPILTKLDDYSNPFFGKDRYDKATKILSKARAGFTYADGLLLLKEISVDGKWGTRLSFVYSRNENAVYYCVDRKFDEVVKWQLAPAKK